MKEPACNVGYVCDECAPKSGFFKDYSPKSFVGHCVKKAFESPGGRKEHMWVIVHEVVDEKTGEMTGELNNEPVYATQHSCGDIVSVTTAEIEEFLAI